MIMLKAGCIVIYALALAGVSGLLQGRLATAAEFIALALLGVHLVELMFVFDKVRLYRGRLSVSILLTLLFGLLHWKPLAGGQGAKD